VQLKRAAVAMEVQLVAIIQDCLGLQIAAEAGVVQIATT
jgi:hypothetical protein